MAYVPCPVCLTVRVYRQPYCRTCNRPMAYAGEHAAGVHARTRLRRGADACAALLLLAVARLRVA